MEEEKNGLEQTDLQIDPLKSGENENLRNPITEGSEPASEVLEAPAGTSEAFDEAPEAPRMESVPEDEKKQPEQLGRPWQGTDEEAVRQNAGGQAVDGQTTGGQAAYGQPSRDRANAARTASGNRSMSIASLVMGILSLLCCCCGYAGIAFGALGIIFALLSRQDGPMDTQAKVGLALSCVGAALAVLSVLLLLFLNAVNMLNISTQLGWR